MGVGEAWGALVGCGGGGKGGGRTVGVDDGDHVDVVGVKDGADGGVAGLVAVDDLEGDVLDGLLVLTYVLRYGDIARTIVVIHSRAWTVPWYSTAGFPGPPEPQRWRPKRSLPSKEVPEEIHSD